MKTSFLRKKEKEMFRYVQKTKRMRIKEIYVQDPIVKNKKGSAKEK